MEVSKCSREDKVDAGETAQLGKHSLCKDESLGSIPRSPAKKNWNWHCMLVSIARRKSLPYTPQIKNKKRGRYYTPCTGSLRSLCFGGQLGLCKVRQDRGCPLPYTYMHVNPHTLAHRRRHTCAHRSPCPQDKWRVLLTVLFHMVLTVRTKASSEAIVRSLLGAPTCPKETRTRS